METSEENFQDGIANIQVLLFGSLVFLVVVFIFGLIVNIPAAVIYVRSRQLRGFTDKFTLYILLTDILALFTFLPISFLAVLQIANGLNNPIEVNGDIVVADEERPLFAESKNFVKESDPNTVPASDHEFSSYCVQQWMFILHQFLFVLTANLAVLGALKVAVERYLAVIAPLHYHKILKSSLVLSVSLTSFIVSIAFAVLASLDPEDTLTTLLASQYAPKCWKRSISWSSDNSMSSKQLQSLSMRFDSVEEVIDVDDIIDKNGVSKTAISQSEMQHESPFEDFPSSLWWWPVLKFVHSLVFFIVPVSAMIFMYARIWSEAKKQNAKMAYQNKGSFILPADVKKTGGISIDGLQQVFAKFKLVQRIKRKARMDRAARVALLTIGLLTLCFGLLYFVQIVMAISCFTRSNILNNIWDLSNEHIQIFSTFLHLLPILLASLHPLLSPLVYVYRYKRVRKELKLLLNSLISKLCCCSNHENDASSICDCQVVVNQFNQLAQKLPLTSNGAASQQMLESQAPLSASTCDIDAAITIDLKCQATIVEGLEGITSEHGETLESSESELSQEFPCERGISSQSSGSNGFFQFFNCWMSSYSRRWNQHRESVTSTASFITLLSTRSKSIPSADI